MRSTRVGIIGGSGLYRIEQLSDVTEVAVATPYGDPSDKVLLGRLGSVEVAFLARHGQSHSLLPHEVPYRANIHALKQLGVQYLISVSAVGSLREEIKPLDLVVPDQYLDFTKSRPSTFFGAGAVAHVSMADPVCAALAAVLMQCARAVAGPEVGVHRGGTYVCIEGPQFSTRAESQQYRSAGAAVIGMTNMPEAKLAREAEIAYASLALVTDWDCWHPQQACVTADLAIANLSANARLAQRVVIGAVETLGATWPDSTAHRALDSSLVTAPADMSPMVKSRLEPLLRRFLL